MVRCRVWSRRGVLVGVAWITLARTMAFASEPGGTPASGGLAFREVWGYVYKGEERVLTGSEPITDVGYFSTTVNDVGRLDQTPPRPQFPNVTGHQRRIHLVVNAPSNRSLMYWCLAKDLQAREALIRDVVAAAHDFDGVQVDFETIRPQDGLAYQSFLSRLKADLPPGKVVSVTVPARARRQDDAFDYAALAATVDKVLVMAYDEHWRTGLPGPIASLDWCRRVCRFARLSIPPEKLVMGLPLYGRAWQVETLAQSLTLAQTEQVLKSMAKVPSRAEDGTPFFEYQQPATLKVFYEDMQSLSAKLALYRDEGVEAAGFWRIGQGPPDLWKKVGVVSQ